MLVRLGFVAMSMRLANCSPSGTVTLGTLNKLSPQDIKRKLWAKAESNIKNTLKIMQQAIAEGIHVYRLSSKLVPFATHEIAKEWNYLNDLRNDFLQMGTFIKENGMRVSAHPDHFTVINTPNDDVFAKSLEDLAYHHRIFQGMGIDAKEGKLVLHIGGTYKNKDLSKLKFINNFRLISPEIRERIILENDDKSFNALDVLEICETLGIPMVLDIHHYYCKNQGEDLFKILAKAFKTWGTEIPKVHFSSPKSPKDFRSHANYINRDDFVNFLLLTKELDNNFDIMIEAKEKDKAVLKLVEDIRNEKYINFNPRLCQFSLE